MTDGSTYLGDELATSASLGQYGALSQLPGG